MVEAQLAQVVGQLQTLAQQNDNLNARHVAAEAAATAATAAAAAAGAGGGVA